MEGVNDLVDVRLLQRPNTRVEREYLIINDRLDRGAIDIVHSVERVTFDMIWRGAEVEGPAVEEHDPNVDALITCGNDPLSKPFKVAFVENIEIELWLSIFRLPRTSSQPGLRRHTQMVAPSSRLRPELLPAPEPDEVVTVLLEELEICIVIK